MAPRGGLQLIFCHYIISVLLLLCAIYGSLIRKKNERSSASAWRSPVHARSLVGVVDGR